MKTIVALFLLACLVSIEAGKAPGTYLGSGSTSYVGGISGSGADKDGNLGTYAASGGGSNAQGTAEVINSPPAEEEPAPEEPAPEEPAPEESAPEEPAPEEPAPAEERK